LSVVGRFRDNIPLCAVLGTSVKYEYIVGGVFTLNAQEPAWVLQ
jgi:hypothetical protein